MAVTTADGYHSHVHTEYAVMGSSRNSKPSDGGNAPPSKPSDLHTDLYEVPDHFSEALAIVETVSYALEAAVNVRGCPHVGAEVTTLQQAVRALTLVHEELDLTIPGGES
jgi:hypothetical protein